MMKYAIIDTETSGLFDFKRPADAPGQPRLASFCMIKIDGDLDPSSDGSDLYEALIKPNGWRLQDGASAVNGLTDQYLMDHGVPVMDALQRYAEAIDSGHVVVSFNAQFDTKIMRAELRSAGMDDRFERTPNICVMRALIGVCRIPAKRNGLKFPTLEEAMRFFRFPVDQSHSARADAMACLQLFRELLRIKGPLTGEVHYAKREPGPPALL